MASVLRFGVLLLLIILQCSPTSEASGEIDYVCTALDLVEKWITKIEEETDFDETRGAWSACSKPCGGGFKSRDILQCEDEGDMGNFEDGKCGTETLFCNAHKCPDEIVTKRATCRVEYNPNFGGDYFINGAIHFIQTTGENLVVQVELGGFPVYTVEESEQLYHGISVNTWGDLTGGCKSTGPIFDPTRAHKGERRLGDFGAIKQSLDGLVNAQFHDTMATLFGKNNLIGRSVVIYDGTNEEGAEAERVGCCVIGLADPDWGAESQ